MFRDSKATPHTCPSLSHLSSPHFSPGFLPKVQTRSKTGLDPRLLITVNKKKAGRTYTNIGHIPGRRLLTVSERASRRSHQQQGCKCPARSTTSSFQLGPMGFPLCFSFLNTRTSFLSCAPFQTYPYIQGGKYIPKWQKEQSIINQAHQILCWRTKWVQIYHLCFFSFWGTHD